MKKMVNGVIFCLMAVVISFSAVMPAYASDADEAASAQETIRPFHDLNDPDDPKKITAN